MRRNEINGLTLTSKALQGFQNQASKTLRSIISEQCLITVHINNLHWKNKSIAMLFSPVDVSALSHETINTIVTSLFHYFPDFREKGS